MEAAGIKLVVGEKPIFTRKYNASNLRGTGKDLLGRKSKLNRARVRPRKQKEGKNGR